jgi:D-glycero-D-manno-heptose 1,7-bisphosphate phosphatase
MKLAILDRDGTINALGDEDFIASPADWQPLPGALEAIARLNHAGWHVVVATNQPGLGRGLFDVAALNAIHGLMHKQLAALGGRIEAIFYCPHAPGVLEQRRDRDGVDTDKVCVVGSCPEHLQAGAALGAALHLVATGEAAALDCAAPLAPQWPPGTRLHANLGALVEHLLTRPTPASTAMPMPALVSAAQPSP